MKIFAILLITILISCGPPHKNKFNIGDRVIIQNQIEGVIIAPRGRVGGLKRYEVQYIRNGEFKTVVVIETELKKVG